MSARQACFDRSKNYADDQEREKIRVLEGMKAGEKVSQALTKTITAYEAINSPSRFFARALAALPNEVQKRLIGQQRADPITVEAQVFAFMNTWARQGVEAASRLRGRSDVIAAIQRSSLDTLFQIHQRALGDLDVAMDEENQVLSTSYGSPAAAFRATPIRSIAPDPNLNRPRIDKNCAVLSTPESSDLAFDDPERFEELTRRCRSTPSGTK